MNVPVCAPCRSRPVSGGQLEENDSKTVDVTLLVKFHVTVGNWLVPVPRS